MDKKVLWRVNQANVEVQPDPSLIGKGIEEGEEEGQEEGGEAECTPGREGVKEAKVQELREFLCKAMEMSCAGCGKAATLGEGCDATLIQCDDRACYVHTWCTTCNKPTKLRRAPQTGEEPKQKCVCLSAKVKEEAYKVL